MKLLTKEILADFKKQGDTENMKAEDVRIIVKFFNPIGLGYWYATEYNEKEELFFGYANITNGELGYFSLKELQDLQLPMGMKIERDLYYGNEHKLAEVME